MNTGSVQIERKTNSGTNEPSTDRTEPAGRPNGVSVVLCCHNSAQRLPTTLAHLMRQEVPSAVRWEVIVIDNASSDGTAAVARELWSSGGPAPLRVVNEPELGLTHARLRGISEAAYEFIAFVDDDNWLAPDWVSTAFEVMRANPRVGVCSGRSIGAFEASPPQWFDRAAIRYAIGEFGDTAKVLNDTWILPWGAGMVLRRTAVEELFAAGFSPLLSDRRGSSLASGGDSEVSLAIKEAGWILRYEPGLRLQHFMPAARLEWTYYLRLVRGQAASNTALDPYALPFKVARSRLRVWLRRRWQFQVVRTAWELLRRKPFGSLMPTSLYPAGSRDAEWIAAYRSRFWTIIRERSNYSKRFQIVDEWSNRVAPRLHRSETAQKLPSEDNV